MFIRFQCSFFPLVLREKKQTIGLHRYWVLHMDTKPKVTYHGVKEELIYVTHFYCHLELCSKFLRNNRSPGEGNGQLQDSCLVNSMDRATWWITIYERGWKRWTRLSEHEYMHLQITGQNKCTNCTLHIKKFLRETREK